MSTGRMMMICVAALGLLPGVSTGQVPRPAPIEPVVLTLNVVPAGNTALAQPAAESPAPSPTDHGTDKWTFTLAPYLWMSSLSADVDAGPVSASPSACFTDLLKDLDMGAQLRFEGLHEDRWGFFVEGNYLSLGDEARARIGRFRIRGVAVDTQFTQAWFDFGGMYRLGPQGRSFDLMLGGRYAYVATDTSVGPFLELDQSKSFVAPLVGGRMVYDVFDRWLLAAQADLGGFGVGEAADLFWGATALMGYRLSESAMLAIGYRYYDMDFSSGRLDLDVQFHGPIVGVVFQF